ncbi:T-cell surface glycoprotein CD8 beta chain isoform X2 [Sorex fumeus]|nr:T-cell surface glycoprotein CD8 beta chain isoform X2 [Sorex fumeus]
MHLHRWLILASQLSALLGDLVLHQTPRNVQVQTNGMVIMSCEMKGSFPTNIITWVKQCLPLNTDCQLEFLGELKPPDQRIYGTMVEKRLILHMERDRYTFNLTNLTPSDSGLYFCMNIHRKKIFGMGTQLNVVDVLPTTAQTTTKSTPKKKVCRLPSPVTQKDLPCSFITLGLLMTGILVLLLCLGVAIRRHRLQRRAQIQFLKQ